MVITRTFDILDLYRGPYRAKSQALVGKKKGEWYSYSAQDYVEQAEALSRGLLAHGLGPGDKLVTVTPNRPEWNILDLGMARIGVIHVPLFTTLAKKEYEALLSHTQPELVIVGTKALYEEVATSMEKGAPKAELFSIDEWEGVAHWTQLRDQGEDRKDELEERIAPIQEGIGADDTATLIYTSGTTGSSKGVLLSHRNLVSNARAASEVFQLQPEERYLCILPLCHIGERMANYQTQLSGCSIYYNEQLGSIAKDMQEIKPHGFGAVPRLLEQVYDRIVSKGSRAKGIKRRLFLWALEFGKKHDPVKEGIMERLKRKLADKLVFAKWREAMGGNVKAIGVGGAAIPSELERAFWAADIKLLNMYGLTETSPIITINRPDPPDLKLGTVGTVIPDVDVKLADDGEILCKGPNVMQGYFGNEKATEEAFDEAGYFRTGDIGTFEEGKFLRITDRKKSLFKLSNGKYIAPAPIEDRLKRSSYIDQSMVIGEGEKFASALIRPDFEKLKEWAREAGIDGEGPEELVENAKVDRLFRNVVEQINEELEKDEQIQRHRLIADDWSVETGMLSPTLKLKRRAIQEKYTDTIHGIYRN
ncbi:MAG: long-chain fatty acid--CoA ligase [Flavobacteriales bacterium]